MAHPDDAEILVGGTLFHLKELGWELGILTMTAWAKGFGRECGSAFAEGFRLRLGHGDSRRPILQDALSLIVRSSQKVTS
jgi:hypothetical protein